MVEMAIRRQPGTQNTILVGDINVMLRQMGDCSVHTIVTSPPYWGLRDYKTPEQVWGGKSGCGHRWTEEKARSLCARCGAWRGSLGNEPTPELYAGHLVEVFREVRRVLRDDGTVWLNLGDSYFGSGVNDGMKNPGINQMAACGVVKRQSPSTGHLKPKDLCGIPWTVAKALQADGWWLRSDVIWAKRNAMPESLAGWRWERCRVKIGEKENAGLRAGRVAHGDRHDGGMQPASVYCDCPGCKQCQPTDGMVLRKGSWRPTRSHEYIFLQWCVIHFLGLEQLQWWQNDSVVLGWEWSYPRSMPIWHGGEFD